MSLAQPPEVGSAAETAAAARAGHRSTLPLAAERDSLKILLISIFMYILRYLLYRNQICLLKLENNSRQ